MNLDEYGFGMFYGLSSTFILNTLTKTVNQGQTRGEGIYGLDVLSIIVYIRTTMNFRPWNGRPL